MKIDIRDMMTTSGKEAELPVSVSFDTFTSRLGDFPVAKKDPFVLSLINEENKHLQIQGETAMTLRLPCDRCLSDVDVTIPLTFDKVLTLSEAEEEASEEEDEGFLEGFLLDVDRLAGNELLMNWPMKVLCREDCKGICKKCGQNLNLKQCGCDQTELDPRMAKFLDFKLDANKEV